MAYNSFTTHQSTILFEQVLIQAKIPFDIIFDDNLKDLSKYSVLVLANQESLSDGNLDLIQNFIKQGGGLVATESSSLYNEWRRRRPNFGLKDLFNVEKPDASMNSPVKNQFGNGRIVYIPSIIPSIKRPPTAPMRNRYWKLPLNWKELVESVKWAAGEELSIEVNAPLTVAVELTEQKNKLMVHLVNFNLDKNPSVTNIDISLKIQNGKKVNQITALSPDEENAQSLKYNIENGMVLFKVPRLKTYKLVVIELD